MDIQLKNIIPSSIEVEDKTIEHQLWGNSYHFKKGEHLLLVAKSGKGKTTLTHILAGIRNDFKGSFYFNDKNSSSFDATDWADLRRENLSFIFQDLQLFDALTVEENLLVKNELKPTFSKEQLLFYMNQLGIADKKHSLCKNISLGQQQRVAIIRALCQPFDWLIMDEPFSHLDNDATKKAFSLILNRVKTLQAGFILTSLEDELPFSFDKKLMI